MQISPSFFLLLSATAAAGYLLVLLLTPLVRACAGKLGVLDHPQQEKIHDRRIPLAGGLAVFIGMHASVAAFFVVKNFLGLSLTLPGWWTGFFLASALLVIMGVIDDVKDISPEYKVSGQLAAAIILYLGGLSFNGLFGWTIIPGLDLMLTLFWLVLISNAINLIDGLDGLATGIAVLAALGLSAAVFAQGAPFEALFLIGFAAACVAFFKYNSYPASIFLGDAGSNLIGFTLGAFTIVAVNGQGKYAALVVPAMCLAIPLFDTALAIWRRTASFVSGERSEWVLARDLEHIHHRLTTLTGSPAKAATVLISAQAALVTTALIGLFWRPWGYAVAAATFIFCLYLALRRLARSERKKTRVLVSDAVCKVQQRVQARVVEERE